MTKKAQPVLSIGMIVKNEEAKLEKCLRALQPLRDAVPCELVIADTGSTDGTRAIAERYADLVFDFVWVNDFSAARNAVMDHCSGLWYLTVDADEYMDADVSELTSFLQSAEREKVDAGQIKILNYNTVEMLPGDYNAFFVYRIVRMASGIRYKGAIHEAFAVSNGKTVRFFPNTVLHHDGYAWKDETDAKGKMQRNLTLLEKELQQHPTNARILMQCIESSNFQPDKRTFYAHKAMSLLQNTDMEEAIFSAPLSRDICIVAVEEKMPEAAEWIRWTQKRFEKSIFIRVDVAYAAALLAHREQRFEDVIHEGTQYLTASDSYARQSDQRELAVAPLHRVKVTDRQRVQLVLAEAYGKTGCTDSAWELLRGWTFYPSAPEIISDWVRVMTLLEHIPDAEEEVLRVFEATESEETESQLRHTYINALLNLFWNGRQGVGVFRRLPGLLGICAAFLSETDLSIRAALLESVTDWGEYPVPLAQDAIQAGISLPDSFYQQPAEKLQEAVTLYISRDEQNATHVLRFLQKDCFQGARLHFAFVLISTVLQANTDLEAEQMQLLYNCFLSQADAYLKWLYNPDILQEENVPLLPGLHRFAWYVLQEQKQLEQQEWSVCICALRQALKSVPAMKHVVDYLLHQVESRQEQSCITPEMKALATQIRNILSQYPSDDPAVQMLMASPAYQKVAPLLAMMEKSESNEDEWI